MKQVRHRVEKIRPEVTPTLDQQFWPVLIAICVVCSIAAGAIVSLVRGPWMWGSLLVLPAAAAVSIGLLYRLDDSRLRRSLQVAILTSLGLHLLLLVLTSATILFGNSVRIEKIVATRQPEKRIVVSNRNQQSIVQQPRKFETPDTDVDTGKTETTATSDPQPVPIAEPQVDIRNPAVQRRNQLPDVPRQGQQLSQRRRNTQNVTPRAVPSAAVQPATAAMRAPSTAVPTAARTDLIRQSKHARQRLDRQPAVAGSIAVGQVAATSQRRRAKADQMMETAKATARIRESEVAIPRMAVDQPSTTTKPASVPPVPTTRPQVNITRTAAQPSAVRKQPSTGPVSAQQLTSRSSRRANADNETTARTASAQPANRAVSSTVPRVATESATPTAIASADQPKRAAQPKSLAIARSTGGIAGVGRSRNLERFTGGETSPLPIASTSSHRRQASRLMESVSLSSLQRAERIGAGRASQQHRVLKADTAEWTKRSGSLVPADRSLEAAAASIDASASNRSHEHTSEKGESMLDMGPPKVVPEVAADRRSGGGNRQLSHAVVRATDTPGGPVSSQTPRVQTAAAPSPSQRAVRLPAAAEAKEPETEPMQRDAMISTPAAKSNMAVAEAADAQNRATAVAGSEASRRVDPNSETAFMASPSASEPDQNDQPGDSPSRVAQSPSVSRDVQVGSTSQENSNHSSASERLPDPRRSEIAGKPGNQPDDRARPVKASSELATSMVSVPLRTLGTGSARRSESFHHSGNDEMLHPESTPRRSETPKPRIETEAPAIARRDGRNTTSDLKSTESVTSNVDRRSDPQAILPAGATLEIDAPQGPIGFAEVAARRIGRPFDASTQSEALSPFSDARFRRSESGGAPAVAPAAPMAREAFRRRNPAALSESGPTTEAAIEAGLEFLARHQLPDGSWTLGQFDTEDPLYQSQMTSDTAATGLALLAFQGAGYNHREFKYASQIKSAIDWLIANQSDDGSLYISADKVSDASCRMYSHAIAALALTEAYGMTQDADIREATQKALDYIADTQDAQKGGWRYFAQRQKRSSDTSVTGWMMMTLQSARLAGLQTKRSTLEGIDAWLRVAQDPSAVSQFRYNPYAVDSDGVSRRHGRQASVTMTSVGLLMRVYSGWGPDDERLRQGAAVLLQQLPGDVNSRQRDTYYWYYATQVMKHVGGEYWNQWNAALHPLLIASQENSGALRGSWHPYQPVPDRWGPQGGRLYVTTMNLLSLEVRYRLLPLYEKTIR